MSSFPGREGKRGYFQQKEQQVKQLVNPKDNDKRGDSESRCVKGKWQKRTQKKRQGPTTLMLSGSRHTLLMTTDPFLECAWYLFQRLNKYLWEKQINGPDSLTHNPFSLLEFQFFHELAPPAWACHIISLGPVSSSELRKRLDRVTMPSVGAV